MRVPLMLGALCLATSVYAQEDATPQKQVAPSPPPSAANAAPAAKPATSAPKPANPNPNVVVLRSETKFWSDAVLNKPVSVNLKDADAKAAVAALAQASGLAMNVVQPPAPAVVNPPVPAPAQPNGAVPAAATPVQPARVSLDFKNQPVRDIMQALAATYHLAWRKEGNVYVLKDTSFVDTLRANPSQQAAPNQRPGMQNNGYGSNNGYRNNPYRRGGAQVAPGVYREQRHGH